MENIKYCEQCKKAFDIDTSQKLCLSCRNEDKENYCNEPTCLKQNCEQHK